MNTCLTWVLVTAAVGAICFALAGCGTPPPATVDAPQLASALRWVGSCAVLCSAIGAVALVIASRRKK